jgi:hypothetical protein
MAGFWLAKGCVANKKADGKDLAQHKSNREAYGQTWAATRFREGILALFDAGFRRIGRRTSRSPYLTSSRRSMAANFFKSCPHSAEI